MKFLHNDPILKNRRKDLRNESTPEEIILWNHLKDKKLGKKFRRQFSIGPYIADFYCHKLKLIIELDGDYHNSEQQKDYDTERDRFLSGQDYVILRFQNDMIHKDLQKVLETIGDHMRNLPLVGGATRR
jgi:very-short-patch-repair endonuclease